MIVACCIMGLSLVFTALRVAYVVGKIVRISPLVEKCERAWASLVQSDSTAALQNIQGLVDTLEEEADTQRALMREREQEHTPPNAQAHICSSVFGVKCQFLRNRIWHGTCLGVDCNLGVSYEPQEAARHLLMTREHLPDSETATPAHRRAFYHRAANRKVKSSRVAPVECLDQLYFQVPLLLPPALSLHTHAQHRPLPHQLN